MDIEFVVGKNGPMSDFDEPTLWRISSFERYRLQHGTSAFSQLDGPTLLPTTLMADLGRLEREGADADVLEVVAACMRHHEAALLCLKLQGLVLPVTLFPSQGLYHCPRDLQEGSTTLLGHLSVLSVEPPGVRPPGHAQHDRVGQAAHYHALPPLLFALAVYGARSNLLNEIAGAAAYRATRRLAEDGISASGALASAAEAMTRETVSLKTVAAWPGMSVERARRLLNGLYLVSSLRVTRGHPAARSEPKSWLSILGGGSKTRR